MNINYLISILKLYLENENTDKNLVIDINKNSKDIRIDFSYFKLRSGKTYVKLDPKYFFDNLKTFTDKCQGKHNIQSESLNNNIYTINMDNKRQINFISFNDNELNIIRSNFNNLVLDVITSVNKEQTNNNVVVEQKEESYNEIYKENKQTRPAFSMGFSTFMSIFLTAIWFLDVFMIALWIFKSIK